MAFHARKIVLVQIGPAAEEYECALLNVHKCVWIIASQWIGNNWNQKTKISTLSRWTGSVLFINLSQHSLWVQGIKAEKNLHSITKWALNILRVGIIICSYSGEQCYGIMCRFLRLTFRGRRVYEHTLWLDKYNTNTIFMWNFIGALAWNDWQIN